MLAGRAATHQPVLRHKHLQTRAATHRAAARNQGSYPSPTCHAWVTIGCPLSAVCCLLSAVRCSLGGVLGWEGRVSLLHNSPDREVQLAVYMAVLLQPAHSRRTVVNSLSRLLTAASAPLSGQTVRLPGRITNTTHSLAVCISAFQPACLLVPICLYEIKLNFPS